MTRTPSDQLKRISKQYGVALHRSQEARFNTFQLARSIADALRDKLGCRDEIISHYAYTIGDAPKWDEFKKVQSPFDSVVLNHNDWVFGIGVTIEIAENSYPKTNLVIPISTTHKDDQIIVSAPIVTGDRAFPTVGDYAADLDSFVTDLANGLENVVDQWAQGHTAKRVGFSTIER